MPAQFDAKSYISKQAFSPVTEVWDHDEKKTIFSSVKKGGTQEVVADIAATSREVCVAAIQSLNFNAGSKLDLELLDGAIATLNAVISNTPSPIQGLKNESGEEVRAAEYELKDSHKATLNFQLNKLKALRALHGKKNGQELLGKYPELYRAIAEDVYRVDPHDPQLQQYATQLGRVAAGAVAGSPNPDAEQTNTSPDSSESVVDERQRRNEERQQLGQAFSLIESARKKVGNSNDAEKIRELERHFYPFFDL